jgi:hypothetical protein
MKTDEIRITEIGRRKDGATIYEVGDGKTVRRMVDLASSRYWDSWDDETRFKQELFKVVKTTEPYKPAFREEDAEALKRGNIEKMRGIPTRQAWHIRSLGRKI